MAISRKLLFLIVTYLITFANALPTVEKIEQSKQMSIQEKLAKLESSFDGRIGVYAINTGNGEVVQYRANEHFPLQSTFKLMGVSELLKQSNNNDNLLQEKIYYTKKDLVTWHPITGKYLANGMTLEALSEAAITYSDNPAINLIMQKMGGPRAVTEFAHSIGNKSFNVEHYEGNLNSNPKNNKDNSTPRDMAISLQKLTLGNSVLTKVQRAKLVTWMKNNTVGYKRIRAGVPIGWTVADKTGSGDYGIANDLGIAWSPLCKPIVLAIYTVGNKQDTRKLDGIVALTTTLVFNELAKHDECFKALFN